MAMNEALDGDLILVDGGEHKSFICDRSITIVGTGFNGAATITADGLHDDAIKVTGARVRISSLNINFKSHGLAGHALTTAPVAPSKVKNCCRTLELSRLDIRSDVPILCNFGHGAEVFMHHCKVTVDAKQIGIRVVPKAKAKVIENEFESRAGHAMAALPAVTGVQILGNCTLASNRFCHMTGPACIVEKGGQGRLDHNSLLDSASDGIIVKDKGSWALLDRNTFSKGKGIAITVQSGATADLIHNMASSMEWHAVKVTGFGTHATLDSNSLGHCDGSGVVCENGCSARIVGCDIFEHQMFGVEVACGSSVVLDNNAIHDTKLSAVIVRDNGKTLLTNNRLNSLSRDRVFVSFTNNGQGSCVNNTFLLTEKMMKGRVVLDEPFAVPRDAPWWLHRDVTEKPLVYIDPDCKHRVVLEGSKKAPKEERPAAWKHVWGGTIAEGIHLHKEGTDDAAEHAPVDNNVPKPGRPWSRALMAVSVVSPSRGGRDSPAGSGLPSPGSVDSESFPFKIKGSPASGCCS